MTTQPQKKKGGARPGAGRKKTPARVVAEAAIAVSPDLDGRSPGGKAHALWLIEQLNEIDPEMIRDLHLSVSPEPYKAKKDATDDERADIEKLEFERRIRWEAKKLALRRWRKLSFEVQGWANHWFDPDTSLETRKYLHDKAGHQAVRVINHVHDKPIEMNVNLSMAEVVRKVHERKLEYERSRS